MTTRRERAKAQVGQLNRELEPKRNETKKVNQRQEKLVLTGVIIASLFDEMTNKLSLYVLGVSIVFSTLLVGLRLSSKTKE